MATGEKTRKGERSLQQRPAAPVMNPWDEMERWFNDFGRRGWLHPFSWDWPKEMEAAAPFEGRIPKVDMIDRDGEVVIRAELPGVKKEDLEVTLAENTVTITAHTAHESKEEAGEYYRREMSRGDFRRMLTVPGGLDESRARAGFADGILELTIPKLEKTPRRKVKVE